MSKYHLKTNLKPKTIVTNLLHDTPCWLPTTSLMHFVPSRPKWRSMSLTKCLKISLNSIVISNIQAVFKPATVRFRGRRHDHLAATKFPPCLKIQMKQKKIRNKFHLGLRKKMLQAKKINCNQTCISCVTGVTGVVRVAEVRQLRHVTFDAKSLVSTGVRSNTVVVDCATVSASRHGSK